MHGQNHVNQTFVAFVSLSSNFVLNFTRYFQIYAVKNKIILEIACVLCLPYSWTNLLIL